MHYEPSNLLRIKSRAAAQFAGSPRGAPPPQGFGFAGPLEARMEGGALPAWRMYNN
ncbi:MAG: hypothetical protein OIN66_03180 [Candidatus Methanoperedens sp.]|nr:hypothetical protein [Candidatus Methanoperedens sp.]